MHNQNDYDSGKGLEAFTKINTDRFKDNPLILDLNPDSSVTKWVDATQSEDGSVEIKGLAITETFQDEAATLTREELTREELSRMDVGELFDQIKDKTSDTAKAFRRMVENIEEAEGSSKLVGASLDKLDALQKKANRNPKHYVTKAQKANTKKWKPSGAIYNKLFGRSKNIVMVKDNDGIIKPMTVKNAKKFGKV